MRLQDQPQRHVRSLSVVPPMTPTWSIGEFHTSPGVQPPEVVGSFYLAGDPTTEPSESVRHLWVVRPSDSDEQGERP